MSIKAMSAAMKCRIQMTDSARLVMFALAWRHNGVTGQCNPSQTTLAEDAGLVKRSVTRAVKELADLKLITKHKTRRQGDDPFRSSDRYTLVFMDPEAVRQAQAVAGRLDGLAGDAESTKRETPSAGKKPAEGVIAGASAKPKRKRSQKKAPVTRIPEDWKPTKKLRDQVVAMGVPEDAIDLMVVDFVDFWQSEGAVKASWPATFSRWARVRAPQFKESPDGSKDGSARPGTGTGGRAAERLNDLRDLNDASLAALERRRGVQPPAEPGSGGGTSPRPGLPGRRADDPA